MTAGLRVFKHVLRAIKRISPSATVVAALVAPGAATGATLRIELPEILVTASWLDIRNDAQLEAVFPSVRLEGSSIPADNLCVRGDHFESLAPVPIWADSEKGRETNRVIIGYERAHLSRFVTRPRCIVEVRDECKRWVYDRIEIPTTVTVEVFREGPRGGRTLLYTRAFEIPACE